MRTIGLAATATLFGLGAGLLASAPLAEASPDTHSRLLCRVFPVELENDEGWDSDDPQHPIGAWIHRMDERGWALATVDLTVGQKRTGYPQGYQQVCLSPR